MAFAEGRGIPRNLTRATEILSGLSDNPEAVAALARLSAETDPETGYAQALDAAEMGAPAATALLDSIERRLTTSEILEAQLAADTELPDAMFASPLSLRDAAADYEEGKQVRRSYALAWRLAASAAAAGDGLSRVLMDRLDARFGGDPAWIESRQAASDAALEDWTGRGLAESFSGSVAAQ